MEQKFAGAAGKSLAYYTQGEGPVVLWIHGLCENAGIWNEILPDFPGYRHIIAELPGCGASEGWQENYISIDAMAQAVLQVLKNEKTGPAACVGHSMGAYVALSILEKHPEALSGICLLHSTATADSEEKKRNRERGIQVFLQNRDLFMREFFRNLFAEDLQTLLQEKWIRLFEQSKRIPASSVTGTFKALRDRKNRHTVLEQYSGAKYYLIGEKDNVLDAGELIRQAKATGSECIVWPDCGHMAFYENPGACARGIHRFLQAVASAE